MPTTVRLNAKLSRVHCMLTQEKFDESDHSVEGRDPLTNNNEHYMKFAGDVNRYFVMSQLSQLNAHTPRDW